MLNQCNFIGRLGRDPEIKYMQSGDAVANFSIALDESYKNKAGEKVEKTEWVNLVAYARTAEIAGQYLKKGSQIFVSARVQTRKWQDKTGADRYTTEFIVSELKMLGSKADGAGSQSAPAPAARPSPARAARQTEDDFDDGIPF